jgi:deoxyribonuclease V
VVLEPRDLDADWRSDDGLVRAQLRLAAETPEPWRPGSDALVAAGCFVAFRRGEAGPGRRGDRAWIGAALVDERGAVLDTIVVPGVADAPYAPGLLGRREGPLLEHAVRGLHRRPDVLLVDATGRDHPRRAGLALHLGARLDIPSVGVTHRPLDATGEPPAAEEVGATAPLVLDGDVVAAWVCTQARVRPVIAHAAWRTDVATAVDVVLRTVARARTPEPLRVARSVARHARSMAERAAA